MTWKFWTAPDPAVPYSSDYMDGYRAGFIDAEKAAARRTRGPNLRRPGRLPVTVAEIVDRLQADGGAA